MYSITRLGRVGLFMILIVVVTPGAAGSALPTALSAHAVAPASGANACLIEVSGDLNLDGVTSVSDIIPLVNFVLKSGLPLQPCVANGDVNCSGSITTADIILLIGHVFKNGMPPCDICAGSALAASCT